MCAEESAVHVCFSWVIRGAPGLTFACMSTAILSLVLNVAASIQTVHSLTTLLLGSCV